MIRALPLFVILLLGSCTIYKNYPIEIYQPGIISVPPETNKVAIVHRNFKYNTDTLLHYYQSDFELKKASNDPQNLDSILVNLSMNELGKNLQNNTPIREIHVFAELFSPHRADKLPALDFDIIGQIASTTNSDLLISLETFSCFYSEYSGRMPGKTNSNEVITVAVWAVYNPSRQQLIERKTMIDTLVWTASAATETLRGNTQLPARSTALQIAAQMAGENYSKRFMSSWKTVNRLYSIPPLPDFAAADELIQQEKWDEAIALWKRYTDDSNGKMAINARFNLALAYEMKDDLYTAQKWLQAAQQIASDYRSKDDMEIIRHYQTLLTKRQNEIKKLNL